MQMYRKIPATVNPELLDSGVLEAAMTYFDTWLTALDITVEEATLYFGIDNCKKDSSHQRKKVR